MMIRLLRWSERHDSLLADWVNNRLSHRHVVDGVEVYF